MGNDSTLLNIDTFVQNVNPLLYQFIVTATKSVRQRQSVAPSICSDRMSVNKHIKKMRQYFILCQLLYCTNPKHPIPIHNILADVVQVCGRSRQLLKILNRLGCTSSPDTHDRFVTFHAETARERSIWEELPRNVFTVASVDNFDMLQSYSAVFCGDQLRSYHGTTLQLVQPSSTLSLTAPTQNNTVCHVYSTHSTASSYMQARSIGNADALAVSACKLQVQSHGEATSSESVCDQRSDSYSFAPGLPRPKSILVKR